MSDMVEDWNETNQRKLDLYRRALGVMVRRAGGHVIIPWVELNEGSDLANRENDDAVEFRDMPAVTRQ